MAKTMVLLGCTYHAEKPCPALLWGHMAGDGRQTMMLTAKADDLNQGLVLMQSYPRMEQIPLPKQKAGRIHLHGQAEG